MISINKAIFLCATIFSFSCSTTSYSKSEEKIFQNRVPAQAVDPSVVKPYVSATPLAITLKYDQKGKLIEVLKSKSALDLGAELRDVYAQNSLDVTKKYLLIKSNQHPGLYCGILFSFSDDVNYKASFRDFKNKILVVEYPEVLKKISTYTNCQFMPYISNEKDFGIETTPEMAFEESTAVLVISKDKIYSSENNPGTRYLRPEKSLMKVDKIIIEN